MKHYSLSKIISKVTGLFKLTKNVRIIQKKLQQFILNFTYNRLTITVFEQYKWVSYWKIIRIAELFTVEPLINRSSCYQKKLISQFFLLWGVTEFLYTDFGFLVSTFWLLDRFVPRRLSPMHFGVVTICRRRSKTCLFCKSHGLFLCANFSVETDLYLLLKFKT